MEQARTAGLTYAVWDTPGTDSQIQVPSERVGPTVVRALVRSWCDLVAFLGGVILMFGARLAGGCASGHGISGSLQLALSGWVFFASVFVSGILTALMLFGKENAHG